MAAGDWDEEVKDELATVRLPPGYPSFLTPNNSHPSPPPSLFSFSAERVSGVTITSHPDKAIEREHLVLNCSSAGSNVSYTWSKGDQTLESGGHITLGHSNLTFSPVTRNDTGNYTCSGRNSFSNSSATYQLDVFCKFCCIAERRVLKIPSKLIPTMFPLS